MIESILVIGEELPDDEPLAFQKGLQLVAAGVGKLHLLQVVYSEMDEHTTLLEGHTRQTVKEMLLEDAEERAKALIEKESPDTPGVTYEVAWDSSLADSINTVCARHDFDLILKTGHRTETLTHTPTDFSLLRVPRIPVMVLRRHAWSPEAVVLAALDFSPSNTAHMALNRKILKMAREVADLTQATLHCCYVVAYSTVLADMHVIEPREQLAKFKNKHESDLLDFVAEYGVEPANVHVRAGHPSKEIPSIASDAKADVVVVGTHQRSGVTGLLLGNTSEKVLHVLRTAILTVKPD